MLFTFGLCGAVSEEVDIGDIVISAEIVREEGASYHYALPDVNAKPDQHLLHSLIDHVAAQTELPVHCGKTVSTDAVFRQTLRKELNWRADGVLGVDMEMSALLTVARFRSIPAVSLLVVSDKHVLEENGQWHWGGQELTGARRLALKLFVEWIKGI